MIFYILAFVCGVFFLQQLPELPSICWAFFMLPFIVIVVCYRQSVFRYARVLNFISRIILAFSIGVLWAALAATYRMHDALPYLWQNIPVKLVGVVSSLPEPVGQGERFRFDVERVITPNAKIPSHLSLAYFPPQSQFASITDQPSAVAAFKPGERWLLTVRLKRPHGTQNPHGFDFEAWALAENIRATGTIKNKADNQKLKHFVWHPKYMIERVRMIVRARIVKVLADRQYLGIIQALVMGDDSRVSLDEWQLLQRTGIIHLMSISGLHITMLSGLVYGLVSLVWGRVLRLGMLIPSRKAGMLAGAFAALCYALLAGFSVPTQRTLYMLLVVVIALWSGRRVVLSQVLGLALLLVVLLDPWAVISAGFWLSFGAVTVLAYASGGRIGHGQWLMSAVRAQWAVTLGSLPLLVFMFHQFSMISPIANAVAIPLVSFVITPLALLGSFLPLDMALHGAHEMIAFCMDVMRWLSQLPNTVWQQSAPLVWTIVPALLGVFLLLLPRGVTLRWLGFLGFLPMLLSEVDQPAYGDMTLTVLDVGQGMAVVVKTAAHTLLYDAGAKYGEQADAGKRVVVPFLQGEGVMRLDGFVVSHDDLDHAGGMNSVVSQMQPEWLLSSLAFDRLPVLSRRMRCHQGQSWQWDGVLFEVIYPKVDVYMDDAYSDNNRSCVLRITSAAGTALLAGDIEKIAEYRLVQDVQETSIALNSDVLIAPHHGSKTSSTDGFIHAVNPQFTVFSVGYLNRFRHPSRNVVVRYEQAGSHIFRSDQDGAVTFRFLQAESPRVGFTRWRDAYRRYWHDRGPR